jgi:hypothetical protein
MQASQPSGFVVFMLFQKYLLKRVRKIAELE